MRSNIPIIDIPKLRNRIEENVHSYYRNNENKKTQPKIEKYRNWLQLEKILSEIIIKILLKNDNFLEKYGISYERNVKMTKWLSEVKKQNKYSEFFYKVKNPMFMFEIPSSIKTLSVKIEERIDLNNMKRYKSIIETLKPYGITPTLYKMFLYEDKETNQIKMVKIFEFIDGETFEKKKWKSNIEKKKCMDKLDIHLNLLHKLQIIHKDLWLGSILITHQNKLFLTDFDLSMTFEQNINSKISYINNKYESLVFFDKNLLYYIYNQLKKENAISLDSSCKKKSDILVNMNGIQKEVSNRFDEFKDNFLKKKNESHENYNIFSSKYNIMKDMIKKIIDVSICNHYIQEQKWISFKKNKIINDSIRNIIKSTHYYYGLEHYRLKNEKEGKSIFQNIPKNENLVLYIRRIYCGDNTFLEKINFIHQISKMPKELLQFFPKIYDYFFYENNDEGHYEISLVVVYKEIEGTTYSIKKWKSNEEKEKWNEIIKKTLFLMLDKGYYLKALLDSKTFLQKNNQVVFENFEDIQTKSNMHSFVPIHFESLIWNSDFSNFICTNLIKEKKIII